MPPPTMSLDAAHESMQRDAERTQRQRRQITCTNNRMEWTYHKSWRAENALFFPRFLCSIFAFKKDDDGKKYSAPDSKRLNGTQYAHRASIKWTKCYSKMVNAAKIHAHTHRAEPEKMCTQFAMQKCEISMLTHENQFFTVQPPHFTIVWSGPHSFTLSLSHFLSSAEMKTERKVKKMP